MEKLTKGATIISMSTNNPLVPGNKPALTDFQSKQDALAAKNALVLATRELLRTQTADRDAAEVEWDDSCTRLADFTQTATGGDEVAILSSGFGVRRANTPKPPLTAPQNLSVRTNGSPGVSKLRWDPVTGAASYLVQCSPDPITETSWTQVASPTKASAEIPGAEPGKLCWFRVAAVGPTGQGPWSLPAQRPVM